MVVRIGGWLTGLLLLVVASGCSSDLVTVTGRVTYKGEPVPSTEVRFNPDTEGVRPSIGRTDDDGRFSLRNSTRDRGAIRGKYTVTLQYAPSGAEESHETPPKASREMKENIAKYRDLSKSTLHYEITKSGQFIEIKLDQ
jgi:hypothetical protein